MKSKPFETHVRLCVIEFFLMRWFDVFCFHAFQSLCLIDFALARKNLIRVVKFFPKYLLPNRYIELAGCNVI